MSGTSVLGRGNLAGGVWYWASSCCRFFPIRSNGAHTASAIFTARTLSMPGFDSMI